MDCAIARRTNRNVEVLDRYRCRHGHWRWFTCSLLVMFKKCRQHTQNLPRVTFGPEEAKSRMVKKTNSKERQDQFVSSSSPHFALSLSESAAVTQALHLISSNRRRHTCAPQKARAPSRSHNKTSFLDALALSFLLSLHRILSRQCLQLQNFQVACKVIL